MNTPTNERKQARTPRKMYWRPHKVSRVELLMVSILALGAFLAVQRWPVTTEMAHHDEKLAAARLARKGLEAIRAERLRRGWRPDTEVDPAQSGLIGSLLSPVTSNPGHLPAKQTSVNPNFAALVVHWLKRCGVEEGDAVAVGVSGSFPALNVAVYAALQTLGARPVIVASASASQWGANDPELLWLDMEQILGQRAGFTARSVAASRGGINDKALGMSKEGRRLLDAGIARAKVEVIAPETVQASIDRRMEIFKAGAEGGQIKAYINVGGGTVSVGARVGRRLFKPGLNRTAPLGSSEVDSVMTRFILDGVPVIHLSHTEDLAQRYGFPVTPAQMPQPGHGTIFVRQGPSRLLAGGGVALILLALFGVVRRDWGFRMLSRSTKRESPRPPEQMV